MPKVNISILWINYVPHNRFESLPKDDFFLFLCNGFVFGKPAADRVFAAGLLAGQLYNDWCHVLVCGSWGRLDKGDTPHTTSFI
jgi:hypothetical protein